VTARRSLTPAPSSRRSDRMRRGGPTGTGPRTEGPRLASTTTGRSPCTPSMRSSSVRAAQADLHIGCHRRGL